jgi:hypothetical protein
LLSHSKGCANGERTGVTAIVNRLTMLALPGSLVFAVAACTPAIKGDGVDSKPHGAIVAVPDRPSPPECSSLIRADLDVAITVRAAIGIDGIDPTREAAQRAAIAPDVFDAPFGIPLTPSEVSLVQAAMPVPDGTTALRGLIAASPEDFNDLWLENDVPVVSVLRPDSTLLRLARCLEVRGAARYVTAGVSATALNALGDRIDGDRELLAREGIAVTVVETDTRLESVTVGVSGLMPATAQALIDRYGTVVRVIESEGPRPAVP